MKTETRAFRAHAPLPAFCDELVVVLAQALGVSLEIWSPASHHGLRLALGPACARCEHEDNRTFDRCRKRRAYLTRPEVELPERLAEKCPRRVRLSRRGRAAPLLFAFGHGIDDAAGESDAAIACFLDDVRAVLPAPDAPDATPATERAETLDFFTLACGREGDGSTRHGTAAPTWLATEMVAALVATLEARRPAQQGHSRRVRLLALLLGREMGLDDATLARLHWAALLHAVTALGAPGPDDGEACALDQAGGQLASEAVEITNQRFERIAGSSGVGAILRRHRPPAHGDERGGGDHGAAIGRAAGCLAVADALDILLAQHTPRRPRTLHTAIAALASAGNSRFDSEVIAALQRLEPQLLRHAWIFLLHRHGTV